MKVNWDAKITTFEGEDFKDPNNGKPVTLRSLAFQALDSDREVKAEEKIDRWELMVRIKNGGDIEKSELKLIKERFKATFTPWVVGTCLAMFNEAPTLAEIPDVAKAG